MKEKRLARWRSIPQSPAVQMLAPLREMPGSTAIPCATPTSAAVLKDIFLPSIFFAKSSVAAKSTAVMTKQIGKRLPENASSKKPLKSRTITTVGIVAMYIIFAGRENGFLIRNFISFHSTITTAKSVAKCKSTLKKTKSSLVPKILLKSTKCPLDETGKNSVMPCKMP